MKAVALDYPGLGLRTGWTMGHPEAITFPRYFSSLSRSLILMATSRSNLVAIRVLGALVNRHLVSLERAAWVEWLEGVGKPAKAPADYVRELLGAGAAKLPPLFAIAVGCFHDHLPDLSPVSTLTERWAFTYGCSGVLTDA